MTDAAEGDGDPTYLGPTIEGADVQGFFEAAARLHAASPWDLIPGDEYVAVTCEALGISDGALTVVGQQGESYGWILFRTPDDAVQFMAAAAAFERGERPPLPEHVMFSYDLEAEMHPALVTEVRERGWPVAGSEAYPNACMVDPDAVLRPLVRDEMLAVTALVQTLADFIEREPRLAGAWDSDEEVRWKAEPIVGDRTIAVELVAPLWLDLPDEVFVDADLAATECVVDEEGELDEAWFAAYRDALLDRFVASPEGSGRDGHHAAMLVEYLARERGTTVVRARPHELRNIVLLSIPRHVVIDPSEAPALVNELRALFMFAVRELGSTEALSCHDWLKPEITKRLEHNLADTSCFGPGKALIVEGMRAGYDVDSEEGLAAWLEVVNARQTAKLAAAKPAGKKSKKRR